MARWRCWVRRLPSICCASRPVPMPPATHGVTTTDTGPTPPGCRGRGPGRGPGPRPRCRRPRRGRGARGCLGPHRAAGRPVRARLVPAPVPRPRLRRDRPMTTKRPTKTTTRGKTASAARPAKAARSTKAAKATKPAKATKSTRATTATRAARPASSTRAAASPRKAAPRARSLPFEVDASRHQPPGMSPEAFLRCYWHKRPLLVRTAFPGYQTPVMPEDLAGLACEDGVLARLISHDRGSDSWDVRHGPFQEEDFPGMPDHDWTLLVQDVDKWDADVAALLEQFRFLPRWRIDDVMISFAATGGSVGAHVDHYDVFLLQAYGHRRWQIDASVAMGRPAPDLSFRKDAAIKLLREFNPSHDWVLAPGDMLYLP